MSERSSVLLISDQPERFLALRRSALAGRRVHLWLPNGASAPDWTVALRGDPTSLATYEALRDQHVVVVVDLADEDRAIAVARAARAGSKGTAVLVIDRVRGRRRSSVRNGIAWVDEGELLAEAVERVLERVAARRHVSRLRHALQGERRCAFLLQHDPDPDAIASALALRQVLGLGASEAPIITCGRVTRPENRRLVRELGLQVKHVSGQRLSEMAPLVLVDVQPPYFGDALPDVAAVVDHHPRTAPYRARFADVRPSYGASATIAAEYLLADSEARLTRELATALLYGIITDTKSLSRSASDADLEMFAYLFPRADHEMLRRIQHPSYSPIALRRFGLALRRAKARGGLAYVHLGRLPADQQHIVAQLAEFCIGIEGAEVAAVSGVFGEHLVMSARALHAETRLGERLREVFGPYGSAGGHAVMAKAVVRVVDWNGAHRVRDERALERSIATALGRALSSRAAGRAPRSRRRTRKNS